MNSLGIRVTDDQMNLLSAIAAHNDFWVIEQSPGVVDVSRAVGLLIDREMARIEATAGSGDDSEQDERSVFELWQALNLMKRGSGVRDE